MSFTHEAVFHTTKPPVKFISSFEEIDESTYVFSMQPYCYDTKASAFWQLLDTCVFATNNDKDADELYRFICDNTHCLEFESR